MIDWASFGVSLIISLVAILFAALTWFESRKARELLETMVKALPYIARPRRRPAKKPPSRVPAGGGPTGQPVTNPTLPAQAVPATNQQLSAAEERRRLRLQLEREKLEWQKNRDIAKAIAWFMDRLAEDDDEERED